MATETNSNPEAGANVRDTKSSESQIVDLLTDAGETGEPEEIEESKPVEEPEIEEDAPQEDDKEEGDKPDPEESKQEDAEEEAETWGKALGLDDAQVVLNKDGNFEGVMTKVDGKTKQVDLKELVKGYQIDEANTNKSKALADDRRQFEQFAQQQAAVLKEQTSQAQNLVDTLKHQLVGEFEQINWEQLRAADPAEYAARRQDYSERYNRVEQMAGNIQQEQQKAADQQQQQNQANKLAHLRKEADITLEKRPEWNDAAVRTKALNDISSFIQTKYGFAADDAAKIEDHRILDMIEDAMAYQAIKTGTAPKIKKAVPKFQKPGGKSPNTTKKAKLDKLYKKAATSTNRDFKDDAITQLLLNS